MSGEASTLAWQTVNASTVTISGLGTVPANGTQAVSPTQTTTYTLTAANQLGQVTSAVTVQVTAGQVPRILSFAATPAEILPTEQALLSWKVENATSVSISGIGTVNSSGSSSVSPTSTTTYVLSATNSAGQVSATAVVSVVLPPKILNFTANPGQLAKAGDTATLSWQTQNATDVVITNVGSVPVNGSTAVKPATDVSYTLTAYGRRSQVSAQVIVRVGGGAGGGGGGGASPVANAGGNQFTDSLIITLDGSKSYDPNGAGLTYSWRLLGNSLAEIESPNSAITRVRLSTNSRQFTFQLTVTNDKRLLTMDTATVTYTGP